MRIHIRSVCCNTSVAPDAEKNTIYCLGCGRDLGLDHDDITKMIKTPIEEPIYRKEHESNRLNNQETNSSTSPEQGMAGDRGNETGNDKGVGEALS